MKRLKKEKEKFIAKELEEYILNVIFSTDFCEALKKAYKYYTFPNSLLVKNQLIKCLEFANKHIIKENIKSFTLCSFLINVIKSKNEINVYFEINEDHQSSSILFCKIFYINEKITGYISYSGAKNEFKEFLPFNESI